MYKNFNTVSRKSLHNSNKSKRKEIVLQPNIITIQFTYSKTSNRKMQKAEKGTKPL